MGVVLRHLRDFGLLSNEMKGAGDLLIKRGLKKESGALCLQAPEINGPTLKLSFFDLSAGMAQIEGHYRCCERSE